MDINKDILDEAFGIMGEYIDEPRKPNEFTVREYMEQHKIELSERRVRSKFNQAVKDGKLKTRKIGQERVYWIPISKE